MIINNLDFKKYKRFFAFGCSFTSYLWPTWVDLIAREMPEAECYNYGASGGGNVRMFQSLMEADARYKIDNNDLVIIMWTNISREDRYIKGQWVSPGNIFTQGYYPESFVDNYVDVRGCLIRDLGLIRGAKLSLERMGVDFAFLSMVPIDNVTQYSNQWISSDSDVLSLYSDTIEAIKPSIFETVFNMDWSSQPRASYEYDNGDVNPDPHPTPELHRKYIELSFPGTIFSEDTMKFSKEQTELLLSDGIVANKNYQYTNPNRVVKVL